MTMMLDLSVSFAVDDEVLNDIIGNVHLSERYVSVARDMDMMEAKTPEDIYKVNKQTSYYRSIVSLPLLAKLLL